MPKKKCLWHWQAQPAPDCIREMFYYVVMYEKIVLFYFILFSNFIKIRFLWLGYICSVMLYYSKYLQIPYLPISIAFASLLISFVAERNIKQTLAERILLIYTTRAHVSVSLFERNINHLLYIYNKFFKLSRNGSFFRWILIHEGVQINYNRNCFYKWLYQPLWKKGYK